MFLHASLQPWSFTKDPPFANYINHMWRREKNLNYWHSCVVTEISSNSDKRKCSTNKLLFWDAASSLNDLWMTIYKDSCQQGAVFPKEPRNKSKGN